MALFGRDKSGTDPLTLMQRGEHRKAVRILELRLKRDPDDFPTKMRLAEAYERSGRSGDAGNLYRGEGESLLADGHRGEGAALLRKAARLLPHDVALRERLDSLEGLPGSAKKADSFSFDVGGVSENLPGGVDAAAKEVSHEAWLELGTRLLPAIFPELPGTDFGALISAERLRFLGSGEPLVREGEHSDALYVVLGGSLRVEGRLNDELLTLSLLGPGNVVGEAAYLKGVPRTATVTAEEPSAVLLIGGGECEFPDAPEGFSDRLEAILEERVEKTLELLRKRFNHYQAERNDVDSRY